MFVKISLSPSLICHTKIVIIVLWPFIHFMELDTGLSLRLRLFEILPNFVIKFLYN